MEKVQAIISKLQQQMQNQAPTEHLLISAQMLVSSLQTVMQTEEYNPYKKVVVTMPNAPVITQPTNNWLPIERSILQRPALVEMQQPSTTINQLNLEDAPEITQFPLHITSLNVVSEQTFTNNVMDEVANTTNKDKIVENNIEAWQQQPTINEAGKLINMEVESHIETVQEQATIDIAETEMPVVESIEAIGIAENKMPVVESIEANEIAESEMPVVEAIEKVEIAENKMPVVEAIEAIEIAETEMPDVEAIIEALPPTTIPTEAALTNDKVVFEIEPIDMFDDEEDAAEPMPNIEMVKPVEKPSVPTFNRESLAAFANVKMTDIPSFTGIPTMAYQQKKEVVVLNEVLVEEDNLIVNNRYKENRVELAQKLENSPIKDLKKAIGINDRFKFINELFRGDEAMYERSLKTIQNYSILPEAIFWMDRELKTKLGWELDNATAHHFYALVKRRFS